MSTTATIKNVTVVIREDSGDEAVYVDGQFHENQGTAYATDIDAIAGGEPITFRHISTSAEFEEWPKSLAELEIK